ncbi:MAG: glycosyltransferase family 2 protein [Acetobacteraceae bacterium]
MSVRPLVDVNLFVCDGEATVGPVIESLLAQTWPELSITLFDDGSSDATPAILADYAARFPAIALSGTSCNGGAVAAFQRAFRTGCAEFVMPKSGDDPIAPDFVEKTMAVLLDHPDCAMCHAAGLVFTGENTPREIYPPTHRLLAIGPDPFARALAVMRTYTSSPSFWGVYRRRCTDRLAPILYRAGWDHALLAELALYGEIRHVPEILFWRHDGGRPVYELARRATLSANRRQPLDGPLAEHRWRTPLITTAVAHLETFAVARIDQELRGALMTAVPKVFRDRWMPMLLAEASALRRALPALMSAIDRLDPALQSWAAAGLAASLGEVQAIVPEANFSAALSDLAMLPQRKLTSGAAGAA